MTAARSDADNVLAHVLFDCAHRALREWILPSRSDHLHKLLAGMLPLIIWSTVVFLLSTQIGSSENTGRVWTWLLSNLPEWITRHMSTAVHDALNAATRKAAHVLEYAVLAALAYRAGAMLFRPPGKHALAFCLTWCISLAISDEIHQSFEPSRTSSAFDVGWDLLGILLGVWLIRRIGAQISAGVSANRSRTHRTKRAS